MRLPAFPAYTASACCLTTTSPQTKSTTGWQREPASATPSQALRRMSSMSCARTSYARRYWRAPTGYAGRCCHSPAQLAALRLADAAETPDLERLLARRVELGLPAGDDDPLLMDVGTGRASVSRRCRAILPGPASCG